MGGKSFAFALGLQVEGSLALKLLLLLKRQKREDGTLKGIKSEENIIPRKLKNHFATSFKKRIILYHKTASSPVQKTKEMKMEQEQLKGDKIILQPHLRKD